METRLEQEEILTIYLTLLTLVLFSPWGRRAVHHAHKLTTPLYPVSNYILIWYRQSDGLADRVDGVCFACWCLSWTFLSAPTPDMMRTCLAEYQNVDGRFGFACMYPVVRWVSDTRGIDFSWNERVKHRLWFIAAIPSLPSYPKWKR